MKKIIVLFLYLLPLCADVGTLKKIIDGDTLSIYSDGRTIKCRIAYIDTPESKYNYRAKRKTQQCPVITLNRMVEAGKEAKKYAKSLLKIGTKYRYKVIGHDRYKRSICIVQLPGDLTFNERMIIDGYATPFWRYIPNKMHSHYKKLLNKAKQEHAGLWRNYKPILECLEKR